MWINDPKTNKKSITATFVLITFVVTIISAILESFEVIKSISSLKEILAMTAYLYAGRKGTDTVESLIVFFKSKNEKVE